MGTSCQGAGRPKREFESCGQETEVLAHWVEVAIRVKQAMPMLNAERSDDQVHSLTNRDAERAELSVVQGGANGQIGVEKRDNRVIQEHPLEATGVTVVAGAPQNLDENEIAD
jgi:hypothetical protein